MACWPVVEIGLAFLSRGHAHGEPPAFQAAQRGFDSLCPLHTNKSPDSDAPVGASALTVGEPLRAMLYLIRSTIVIRSNSRESLPA